MNIMHKIFPEAEKCEKSTEIVCNIYRRVYKNNTYKKTINIVRIYSVTNSY